MDYLWNPFDLKQGKSMAFYSRRTAGPECMRSVGREREAGP